MKKSVYSGSKALLNNSFMQDNYFVTADTEYQSYTDITQSIKFMKAGPRVQLFCEPAKVKAIIVTCGGLCPGLNVVIRELVMTLHYNYEVKEIHGVKWGYKGIYSDIMNNWIRLDPSVVKNIHK